MQKTVHHQGLRQLAVDARHQAHLADDVEDPDAQAAYQDLADATQDLMSMLHVVTTDHPARDG